MNHDSASGLRLNLRLRIALAFAAVCMVVVGALGITLYTAANEMERGLIDQILSEEVDYLIERHRDNAEHPPAPGPNLAYFVVQWARDVHALPREIRELLPGKHEIRISGEQRHVTVRQVGDTRYIVTYEVGQHENREQRFKNVLLLSLAAVAIMGLPLGYWLAGVLTRQLTELTQRVARLSPEEPHPPLARAGQDADVAALARVLDDYQARIARMMQHEQEFTANASHELRTPLTAIRTSCELLLGEPGLPDKARTRVQMIDEATRRMAEQLHTLLFIAREQVLGATEDVALAECVSDAAEPYRGEITRKGIALSVDIDAAAVLMLNRQALHTVLANLIRNAVQHTERGSIRVSFAAGRLTVADSGRGIAPQSLPRIFERFYSGHEDGGGFGLGLAIAKRICDQYGWHIEVESTAAAGSAFSIGFAKSA
jgi:signal transduction histidine kinase